MTYEEVKNAPLNVLVGYLTALYEDYNCPCRCKWETYCGDKSFDTDYRRQDHAEFERKRCIGGDSYEGQDYSTCPQRLAYERVMEAVEKQVPKKYHRTRTIEQVIGGARETVCPSCLGVTVTCENQFPKYCAWCGSALKDGDEQ